MKLIIGLGNPGDKYKNTRHNMGFMVIDELAEKLTEGKVKWQDEKKFSAQTCRISEEILLVKPQTFMNDSGVAVAKILRYYDTKILSKDVWVIHDDMDISLGKIKIRMGGSGAGHHGIESIIESLGTDKFLRFRLGIGNPRREGSQVPVEDYVLKKFESSEVSGVKHMIKQTLLALEVALKDGVEKAMNEYNR